MKHFLYYPTTYNSSYTQIFPKIPGKICCFQESLIGREYTTYVHMKYVFCSSHGIGKNGTFLCPNECMDVNEYRTVGSYQHITVLTARWGFVFAHWLQDCLPALFVIPEEIWKKSMIIVPIKVSMAYQWLKPFGIEKSRIICGKNKWYFAQNAYMSYGKESLFGFSVHSWQKLVSFLREAFHVNDVKATKYVFSNKKKHEKRSISNFAELINQTRKQFPQYQWEEQDWNYRNVANLVLQVAEIKVLIIPSGSKAYYEIFMNQDYTCGVVLIMGDLMDIPIYNIGLSLKIWQIGHTEAYSHWSRWKPCNISYTLTCIEKVLYAVQNQKWPDDIFNDFREVFDIPAILKFSRENPEVIVDKSTCAELHKVKQLEN